MDYHPESLLKNLSKDMKVETFTNKINGIIINIGKGVPFANEVLKYMLAQLAKAFIKQKIKSKARKESFLKTLQNNEQLWGTTLITKNLKFLEKIKEISLQQEQTKKELQIALDAQENLILEKKQMEQDHVNKMKKMQEDQEIQLKKKEEYFKEYYQTLNRQLQASYDSKQTLYLENKEKYKKSLNEKDQHIDKLKAMVEELEKKTIQTSRTIKMQRQNSIVETIAIMEQEQIVTGQNEIQTQIKALGPLKKTISKDECNTDELKKIYIRLMQVEEQGEQILKHSQQLLSQQISETEPETTLQDLEEWKIFILNFLKKLDQVILLISKKEEIYRNEIHTQQLLINIQDHLQYNKSIMQRIDEFIDQSISNTRSLVKQIRDEQKQIQFLKRGAKTMQLKLKNVNQGLKQTFIKNSLVRATQKQSFFKLHNDFIQAIQKTLQQFLQDCLINFSQNLYISFEKINGLIQSKERERFQENKGFLSSERFERQILGAVQNPLEQIKLAQTHLDQFKNLIANIQKAPGSVLFKIVQQQQHLLNQTKILSEGAQFDIKNYQQELKNNNFLNDQQ